MPSVEVSGQIRAPAEFVFRIVTDPRRGPEWNSNIVDVSNVQPYPVQLGSTWQQTVMMMGRAMRLTCRVARFNPPGDGLVEISGAQKGRVWTVCRQSGDVTDVTQGMEFVPPGGILGRMGEGLMRSALANELRRTVERQKLVVEDAYRREVGNGSG